MGYNMTMSKKISFAFLTIALVAGMAFVAPAPRAQAATCLNIGQNLKVGDYDLGGPADVTALQTYLFQSGFMNHAPTGYFGSLTRSAVIQFQGSYGILQSGFVGPLTRAKLQNVTCTGGPVENSTISLNPTSGPVGTVVTISGWDLTANSFVKFGSGQISNVTYTPAASYTCNLGAPACVGAYPAQLKFTIPEYMGVYCPPNANCIAMAMALQVTPGTYAVSVVNPNGTISNSVNFTVTGGSSTQQFSITSISSPATLAVGASGTWTINVQGNGGGNLQYSAVWGDEWYSMPSVNTAYPQAYQSSASFTHTYSLVGTFHPTFTVKDQYGNTGTVSSTVTVAPH